MEKNSIATNSDHRGYTLLELSIVLMIIGVLSGGIVVAKDMIAATQIRQVISEERGLETAIQTFEYKYNCIPGDCQQATQFWGQASDCTGATTLSATSGTCNGSGDGIICSAQDPYCENGSYAGENLFAAHHLQLSGLVTLPLTTPVNHTQKYVGLPILLPGQNTFASTFQPNIGWSLVSIQGSQVATTGNPMFCGSYPGGQNVLVFGGAAVSPFLGFNNLTVPGAAYISGQIAYSIDSKIDDGMPGTGYVVSPDYSATNDLVSYIVCNTSYQSTVTYNLNKANFSTTDFGRGGLVFLVGF